ncbi:MAG: hypothetical protein HRT89_10770 [Lentisphaeria bacterium]|nr:hypothetical protein [Lentisphaeria bacterium]NQZ68538.1 hypothetical protein [Lentisphaeria bacterium]
MSNESDIWYAAKITRVIRPPEQTLETFGATTLTYHVISELMDNINKVRVRTGKVISERPQIITPRSFANQLLDGFGDKAQEYADFLINHGDAIKILQYGLQFRKEHISSETLSEPLDQITEKVKQAVIDSDDPLAAVIVGADELWEVSLLKFLRDYIEKSAPHNFQQINSRAHEIDLELEREIEMDFQVASIDPSKAQALGNKLQRYGIFEKYEDRFYRLFN